MMSSPSCEAGATRRPTDEPAPMSTDVTPSLQPWLREILRCPVCHGELTDDTAPQSAGGGPELQCRAEGCRRGYPVDGGIPVLLVDEARPLDG